MATMAAAVEADLEHPLVRAVVFALDPLRANGPCSPAIRALVRRKPGRGAGEALTAEAAKNQSRGRTRASGSSIMDRT
jgi:cation transport ATPase